MPTQNAELITHLNTLLRLTAHEAATARVRVSQATTDATRKELTENARNCDRRAAALRQAVRDLGGAPDLLGVALGKAAAVAKLPLEQSQPMTEALLADLALEHQLFDRARLVKVLAADADAADLVALAERLENAHGDAIQWLFTVLSETAIGGPAALAPTGMQAAASTARAAATFAGSTAATGLNRVVATAGRVQGGTAAAVSTQVGRLSTFVSSARRVVTAGRDASLAETEKQVGKQVGKDKANVVHQMRARLGAVDGSELPIPGYDSLTLKDAAAAVSRLTSADDVRVVLAYERAHKNRQGVVEAGDRHVADLAKELAHG
ncbi:MAG: ferritin-like domain-containing protein [Mycobacteriales bacterium]